MQATHSAKFQELVSKLREIFQIDRPDLDFGIYRILNSRQQEINDYLEKKLPAKVADSLAAGNTANIESVQEELKKAIDGAAALGVAAESVPKVLELKAKLAAARQGSSEYENAVFSHLLVFFSRYYEKGDFLSLRRYKGDTYAIPYAGEEVVLHWANKDQYYTKSGESFTNYSFRLEDGRLVHFRLVAADTAKDNNKDNEKERRFTLVEAKTVTRVDEEGEEYEENLVPVEEITGDAGKKELVIYFEYKAQPKGSKQETLIAGAVETVLGHATVKAHWLALEKRTPTEKKPQRTLLEKHLTDYTAKHTADYFIHKDLGGFLRRELDFYIKNEVLHLDDVQNADTFAAIEQNLRMIQCLRAIAGELIVFLAQLEDFQKKLWLKKKFVVETNYCITLDRVPPSLYAEIAKNEAQIDEWEQLFAVQEAPGFTRPLTPAFLQANTNLVLDTRFFDDTFKAKLLTSIDNFDEQCDGLLVHSENFQALNLLQERYKEQVKCVYIDPPYNTDASPIMYKNGYKNSSWCSLLLDRAQASFAILSPKAVFCAAIDDFQVNELTLLLQNVFMTSLGVVSIRTNPSGRPNAGGFLNAHEYALFFSNDNTTVAPFARSEEQNKRYKYTDASGRYMWELLRKRGSDSERADSPKAYYPFYVSDNSIRVPEMLWHETSRTWEIIEKPLANESTVFPIDEQGIARRWRWGVENARKNCNSLKAERTSNESFQIYYKYYPPQGVQPSSLWINPKYSAVEHGTGLVKHFFSTYDPFSFPKSVYLVADCLQACNVSKTDFVFDYFAGSGTTGHAVINLNREDGGKRKYILVEMGTHFSTVLKPRIAKVVYASEWKNSKPVARNTGISHCFKYIRLESYEDALNNLKLQRSAQQTSMLDLLPEKAQNDYLVQYMLDVESKGSLLSVEDFAKPFHYT